MSEEAIGDDVIALLSEHDLHIPPEEVRELIPGYRAMRASARLLRTAESATEEIAVTFDPAGPS